MWGQPPSAVRRAQPGCSPLCPRFVDQTQSLHPPLLKFHLLTLHAAKEPAPAAALRQALPLGLHRWAALCVLLTNGIWMLFPLVLGQAADDLNSGVTRHKLAASTQAMLLAIAVDQGHLPVPDAMDCDRRLTRH